MPTEVPEGYPYNGQVELLGLSGLSLIASTTPVFSFISSTCTGLNLNSTSGIVSGVLLLGSGESCHYQIQGTFGSQVYQSDVITVSVAPTLTMSFDKSNLSLLKGGTAESVKLLISPAAPFATTLNYRLDSLNDFAGAIANFSGTGTIQIPARATEVSFEMQIPSHATLTGADYQTIVLEDGVSTGKPKLTAILNETSNLTGSAVSTGNNHGCLISAGGLYCWGTQYGGVLGNGVNDSIKNVNIQTRIGVLSNWQKISASQQSIHTCGIESGALYCWGFDNVGQIGNGAPSAVVTTPLQIGVLTNWQEISAGDYHNCGIAGGELYCWGSDMLGQIGNGVTVGNVIAPQKIGALTTWQKVSAGSNHSCGIAAGELYCWGYDGQGQVGNGATTGNVIAPEKIGALTNWQNVSVGSSHSCGIESGELYCWGEDSSGQVGNGATTGTITSPTKIGTLSNWTSISANFGSSCGIESGRLYCWGANSAAGAGVPSAEAPTQVGESLGWTVINAGSEAACGINNGHFYCWGEKGTLPLGPASAAGSFSPLLVNSINSWQKVITGRVFTCGISDGKVYCWGAGVFTIPTRIGFRTDWQTIAGTGETDDVCGIASGSLYCWSIFTDVPVRVGSSSDWTSIAVSSSSKCGINSGQLYCWGYNYYNTLGFGLTTDVVTEPTIVGSSSTWQSVYAGYDHLCGINDGRLFCWGRDASSQIGNGSGSSANVIAPEQIGSSTTWQKLGLGRTYSCGIDAGRLFCWGQGGNFVFGNNSTSALHIPTQIGVSSSWQLISPGQAFNCGIDAGLRNCMGTEYSGQMGTGYAGTQAYTTVTAIGGELDWADLSSSEVHACGIRQGRLYCWGKSEYLSAELFGRTFDTFKPVPIMQ